MVKIGIGVPTTIEGVSGDLLPTIADLDQVERLCEVV